MEVVEVEVSLDEVCVPLVLEEVSVPLVLDEDVSVPVVLVEELVVSLVLDEEHVAPLVVEELLVSLVLVDVVEELFVSLLLVDVVEELFVSLLLVDVVEELFVSLLLVEVVEELLVPLVLVDVVEELFVPLVLEDELPVPLPLGSEDEQVSSFVVPLPLPLGQSGRELVDVLLVLFVPLVLVEVVPVVVLVKVALGEGDVAFGRDAVGVGVKVGPLLDVVDREGRSVAGVGVASSDPPPAPNAPPSMHPERLTARAAMPTTALENRIAIPARRCREKGNALGLHRTDDASGVDFAGKGRPAVEALLHASRAAGAVAGGRRKVCPEDP